MTAKVAQPKYRSNEGFTRLPITLQLEQHSKGASSKGGCLFFLVVYSDLFRTRIFWVHCVPRLVFEVRIFEPLEEREALPDSFS